MPSYRRYLGLGPENILFVPRRHLHHYGAVVQPCILFSAGGHWSTRAGKLNCSHSRWRRGKPWLLCRHVSHPVWCSAQTCHFFQWIQWFDVQNAVSIWRPCQCGERARSADRSFSGNSQPLSACKYLLSPCTVCVCVHCVYMYVFVHSKHVFPQSDHVEARGQPWISSLTASQLILWGSLSLTLEHAQLRYDGWTASPRAARVSTAPALGLWVYTTVPWFYVSGGIWNQVIGLCSRHYPAEPLSPPDTI